MATKKATKKPAAAASADPTIIDPRTGLEWSPTLGERVNWKTAKKVAKECRAGGHADWRLPTIEEQITLIDFSRTSPAANTDLFPDMQSSWYWSATPLASSPGDYAWYVYFGNGNVSGNYQGYTAFVRAVRGSRASQ